jgi:hypothetical protein
MSAVPLCPVSAALRAAAETADWRGCLLFLPLPRRCAEFFEFNTSICRIRRMKLQTFNNQHGIALGQILFIQRCWRSLAVLPMIDTR